MSKREEYIEAVREAYGEFSRDRLYEVIAMSWRRQDQLNNTIKRLKEDQAAQNNDH